MGAVIGLGVICLIWLVVALASCNERINTIIMWHAPEVRDIDYGDDDL